MRKFLVIGALSVIHYILTVWSVGAAFESSMGHLGSGMPPNAQERLVSLPSNVLEFPVMGLILVLGFGDADWTKGLLLNIPLFVNSAIWGCLLYFLGLAALMRRRAAA